MFCICCNIIATGLKSVFWLRMKTLCYHLHRGLLLEFLVQLKKMLCLLILWLVWEPATEQSLQVFIVLPAITPPRKRQNGPAPCASGEKKCKGQLWVSAASFQRELFADKKFAKGNCLSVGLNVLLSVLAFLLNQPPHWWSESHRTKQAVHLPFAAPQKET